MTFSVSPSLAAELATRGCQARWLGELTGCVCELDLQRRLPALRQRFGPMPTTFVCSCAKTDERNAPKVRKERLGYRDRQECKRPGSGDLNAGSKACLGLSSKKSAMPSSLASWLWSSCHPISLSQLNPLLTRPHTPCEVTQALPRRVVQYGASCGRRCRARREGCPESRPCRIAS